jgi:hypothetical protein
MARLTIRGWSLVLASCGRIGFDPSDGVVTPVCMVPVGHDEDHDGIDDACDVCPHVADGPQLDRDGDRVGDACDPDPDTGGSSSSDSSR